MKKNHLLGIAALAAALLASNAPAAGQSAGRAGAEPTDAEMAKGCWVRLFNVENFKGTDEKIIVGPVELQTMKMPTGRDWSKKTESLIVGPKARVTVFENQVFRNRSATFDPDQKVDSLRKKLGFLHSIDSLKLVCTDK